MATDKSVRITGQASYASNFEVKKQALLDARQMILTTAADLVKPTTWEDEDGNVWLAKGLTVSVMNNGGKPELYVLKDPDNYTNAASWVKIGDIADLEPLVLDVTLDGTGGDSPMGTYEGADFNEIWDAVNSSRLLMFNSDRRRYIPDTIYAYSSGSKNVQLYFYEYFGRKNGQLVLFSDGTCQFVYSPLASKSDIGLGNVTNDAQVKRSEMGKANGVATLGSDGKVPSAQLPSYVDDVLELAAIYPAKANIPTSGLATGALYYATSEKKIYKATSATAVDAGSTPEAGKIYVITAKPSGATADVNTSWRWSGTAMVQIAGGGLVLGTTTDTAFDGGKGQALQTWKDAVDGLAVATGGSVSTTEGYVDLSLSKASMATGAAAQAVAVKFPAATASAAGVMAAADKKKLDALPEAAEVVTAVTLKVETI